VNTREQLLVRCVKRLEADKAALVTQLELSESVACAFAWDMVGAVGGSYNPNFDAPAMVDLWDDAREAARR